MKITLLTQKQVEQYLQLKASTLEQWRLAGKGPKFIRLGRSIRYRIEDIEDFVETLTRYNSTSEYKP